MTTALKTLSRAALEKKVESADRTKVRDARISEELGNRVLDIAGSLTAGATAAAIGVAEERFKNGPLPLSLGPVPLTMAAGALLGGVSLFWNPGRQVSYAAAGATGAWAVTRGRAWGTAWRAMSSRKSAPKGRGRKKKVGGFGDELEGNPFDEALSEQEAALLAELEAEL